MVFIYAKKAQCELRLPLFVICYDELWQIS